VPILCASDGSRPQLVHREREDGVTGPVGVFINKPSVKPWIVPEEDIHERGRGPDLRYLLVASCFAPMLNMSNKSA